MVAALGRRRASRPPPARGTAQLLARGAGAPARARWRRGSSDLELAAEDVRLAARALERITGRIDPEDVLDRVFASFCIGK